MTPGLDSTTMPSANAPNDAILLVVRSGYYTRSQAEKLIHLGISHSADTVDMGEAMMT
jgi:hypothetical protein